MGSICYIIVLCSGNLDEEMWLHKVNSTSAGGFFLIHLQKKKNRNILKFNIKESKINV